jgi:hypothetical protein
MVDFQGQSFLANCIFYLSFKESQYEFKRKTANQNKAFFSFLERPKTLGNYHQAAAEERNTARRRPVTTNDDQCGRASAVDGPKQGVFFLFILDSASPSPQATDGLARLCLPRRGRRHRQATDAAK